MANLNGAYYGPTSTPKPFPKIYHQSRGGGGCNPFQWCCSCIFNCICTCIYQIIVTILIILGIIIFICWLIFRPEALKFYVTDAFLTEFTLENTTLRYNIALNVTVRNPNRRIGIYYDRIGARAFYERERFASTDLTRFYQHPKSNHSLSLEFKGQNLILLGDKAISKYNEEKNSGVYEIKVKLYLWIRMKFSFVKSTKMKPEIGCDLEMPLRNGTNSSGNFESKKCHLAW